MEITDEMLLNAPATIRSVKQVEAKYSALLDTVGRMNDQHGKLLDLIEGLGKRLYKAEDWALKSREDILKLRTDLATVAMGVTLLDERVSALPVLGGLVK